MTINELQRAVSSRLRELNQEANSHFKFAEVAKVSSAACFFVGATTAVSVPISPVIAAIGLGCYAYSVFADWRQTGEILPLPIFRAPLGSGDDPSSPVTRTIYSLDPSARIEYQLLAFHGREIAAYLAMQHPEHRESLYQSLLNEAISRGVLPEPLEEIQGNFEPELPPRAVLESFQQVQPNPGVQTQPNPPKSQPVSQPLSEYFDLFRYRPILIWGAQGSGKSTVAREVVRLKRDRGEKVYVLNPHGASVQWRGCPVIGAGRNYNQMNEFLAGYLAELTRRYQNFANSGQTEDEFLSHLVNSGQGFTVVCEEMSGWVHNLDKDLLGSFSLACLSESRKVLMPPMFIAHDRSLDFLGLKRGANLRDGGLVELELAAPIQNPNTHLLESSGLGTLRIPGGQVFQVHFDNFGAQQSEQSYQQSASSNEPESSHDLQPLIDYSLRNGWVKAADIQRNVRAYSGFSTAAIRELFLVAIIQGIGKVKGEGDRIQFNANSSAV